MKKPTGQWHEKQPILGIPEIDNIIHEYAECPFVKPIEKLRKHFYNKKRNCEFFEFHLKEHFCFRPRNTFEYTYPTKNDLQESFTLSELVMMKEKRDMRCPTPDCKNSKHQEAIEQNIYLINRSIIYPTVTYSHCFQCLSKFNMGP